VSSSGRCCGIDETNGKVGASATSRVIGTESSRVIPGGRRGVVEWGEVSTFNESSSEMETNSSEGVPTDRCCGMGGTASDGGASVASSVEGSE
jgi:hypothetical protein